MARTLFSRKALRWAESTLRERPLSEETELTPRFSSLRSVASPNARTHVLSLSSSSDADDMTGPGEYWSLLGALGFRDRRLEVSAQILTKRNRLIAQLTLSLSVCRTST